MKKKKKPKLTVAEQVHMAEQILDALPKPPPDPPALTGSIKLQ